MSNCQVHKDRAPREICRNGVWSCYWCGGLDTRFRKVNGTNKVVLTQKERQSLEMQIGEPIGDMHDAKRALKAKGLRFVEPGERTGVPSKSGQKLFSAPRLDIHEIHRQLRGNR